MLRELKDLYYVEDNSSKTILAISHGSFLNNIMCTLTNNVSISKGDLFLPVNNSMAILDFQEVKKRGENAGKEEKDTYVEVKLTAYNYQILGE